MSMDSVYLTEMSSLSLSGDAMEQIAVIKNFPNDFPNDVLRDIFSRVPLKPLTRLMTFSKSLYEAISLLRSPITTSYGLVLFSNLHGSCITTSLFGTERIDVVGDEIPFLDLFDSRNGLLLYGHRNFQVYTFYVVASANLQEWNPLPLPPVRLRYCRILKKNMCFRLFGDEIDKFTVLIHDYSRAEQLPPKAVGKIFNSNTWAWKDFKTDISGSEVMNEPGFCFTDYSLGSGVYKNGKLYSLWSTCLLTYDTENESFELVKLPQLEALSAYGSMLFESEGCFRLCAKEGQRHFIFYDYNGDNRMWERRVYFDWENVVDGQIGGELQYGQFYPQPFAFNEELQQLYFVMGRRNIIAYCFVTRRWTWVVAVTDGFPLSKCFQIWKG